jgi:hypothetical protein
MNYELVLDENDRTNQQGGGFFLYRSGNTFEVTGRDGDINGVSI